MRHKLLGAAAAIAVGTLAASGLPGIASGAGPAPHTMTEDEAHQLILEAGFQTAPKQRTLQTHKVNGKVVNAANPYLGQVADPSTVDWSYWRNLTAKKSAQRAVARQSNARTIAIPTPFAYDEKEPAGTLGSNDGQANAEPVAKFGLAAGKTAAVRILGELHQPDIATADLDTTEDQGAIPIATDTGIPATNDGVTVSSAIGDGPNGTAGTGTGDFDFFKVSADAGQVLRANTYGSAFDTVLVVYDSTGQIVDANDDAGGGFQSEIGYEVPTSGDYYVMVSGYIAIPADPFDSASGTGAGDEGDYDLDVTVGGADTDYYAVRLRPGDVLGGTISGAAADIVVHKFDGADRIGSTQDLSSIYPSASPLPGGGNGVASYVAEEAGLYAVSTSQGSGAYQMQLEVYRPGSEYTNKDAVQTIFLDFNGARVNTAIFGGGGQSTLSPLSSFLARWGLPATAEDNLINRIVMTVKENLKHDLIARGLNRKLRINVLNSRDHADPWGNPNVSRVIVGGTIAQSGVDTIGIAQSIDPGNYGHEESALVLLDIVSDSDPEQDASFNYYITPSSNKIKFIGTALGNVTSHEVGHFVGSFHVDQFNDVLNLMDQGGNFPLLYGVGDDGVGGTADDPDIDFGIDTYNPNEGLTGLEDTLNNSAWAFVPGQ